MRSRTTNNKTILCVEDDAVILKNNRVTLAASGYKVLTAERLADARAILAERNPDGIVLDIILPDGTGIDLLTELRGGGSKIPVLLLTAWGKPSDVARGLKAGANDYLSKPFEYEVLLARVEAMFRNAELMPERISHGPVSIDILSRQAFLNGENMYLTQKEVSLLQLFVQNPGRIIDVEYLYERVWGQPMLNSENAIKVMMSKLRAKLVGTGYTITASRGEGYCYEME